MEQITIEQLTELRRTGIEQQKQVEEARKRQQEIANEKRKEENARKLLEIEQKKKNEILAQEECIRAYCEIIKSYVLSAATHSDKKTIDIGLLDIYDRRTRDMKATLRNAYRNGERVVGGIKLERFLPPDLAYCNEHIVAELIKRVNEMIPFATVELIRRDLSSDGAAISIMRSSPYNGRGHAVDKIVRVSW